MITISTNKGLTKIEDWEDISSRPGFAASLNPAEHKLDAVIGRYSFPDKIRCGLSNCHKPHNKGYIVTTVLGIETNIGKDCGKTYFGIDFEIMTKQFDRDITEQENRELLWSFSHQVSELEAKIQAVKLGDKGANWVHKHSQSLSISNTKVPHEISQRMSALAKSRSNILYSQRLATEQEVENLEVIQQKKLERPHYLNEPIGELSGIEALYPENNLCQIVVINLEENLKAFKNVEIDQLSYEQLAYWKKWAGTVDSSLENAKSIIEKGRLLLTPHNLAPLLNILDTGILREQFRSFIDSLKH
ncbi:hypothetical protein ACIQW9_07215 [Herminiimonas sp. NPDC097707]|uniref:hypothetical protein n=1 Tax=Herminiimonas sp. NPDC097707 TaxID=3364007 RepID=UPI00383BA40F